VPLLVSLNEDNTVAYKSITACISALGNAKHMVTIEGVTLNEKLIVSQEPKKSNYVYHK